MSLSSLSIASDQTFPQDSTIPAERLLNRLRWRYATKKFDPSKKIDSKTWAALEETLVLSPSSYGLQPWKFLVVQDPAVRARLQTAAYNQSQVSEASHLVVLAYRHDLNGGDVDRFVDRIAEVRGVPRAALEGYEKLMKGFVGRAANGFNINQWSSNQLYIALGNFLTAAALLGVDTTPMEGIQPVEFDKILGLTNSGYRTQVAVAAGTRAADDATAALPKVRFGKEKILSYV